MSLLRTTPRCRWSTIRDQSPHSFQVSVLLDLLLSIFFLLNDGAFDSLEILLVPPFPLVLLRFLQVVLIMVVFTIAVTILFYWHDRRSIKSRQISIASKPLQQWVLMELWNSILRNFSFWNTKSIEGCLVDLLEHVDHLSTLLIWIFFFRGNRNVCLIIFVSFLHSSETLRRDSVLGTDKSIRLGFVVSLDFLGRLYTLHLCVVWSLFTLFGSSFSRSEQLLSSLQLLRLLLILLLLLSCSEDFISVFLSLLAEILNLNLFKAGLLRRQICLVDREQLSMLLNLTCAILNYNLAALATDLTEGGGRVGSFVRESRFGGLHFCWHFFNGWKSDLRQRSRWLYRVHWVSVRVHGKSRCPNLRLDARVFRLVVLERKVTHLVQIGVLGLLIWSFLCKAKISNDAVFLAHTYFLN